MATLADLTSIFPPADRTLPLMLARQAETHGDRAMVVFGDESWSYRDTARIAARSARSLAEAGVAPGDRVALVCGNRPEFLRIFLGCAWLGAIAVPINTASRGAQLVHIKAWCGERPGGIRGIDAQTAILDAVTQNSLPRHRVSCGSLRERPLCPRHHQLHDERGPDRAENRFGLLRWRRRHVDAHRRRRRSAFLKALGYSGVAREPMLEGDY